MKYQVSIYNAEMSTGEAVNPHSPRVSVDLTIAEGRLADVLLALFRAPIWGTEKEQKDD